MRIRPYIECRDYEYLEKWDTDERTHALWCADLIPYPLTREGLRSVLEKAAGERMDCAYVATEEDGKPVGFFCYAVNTETNLGFFRFVIVDADKRGAGYGQRVLKLALRYAFEITGAEKVQLNVFAENEIACGCYEKAGFAAKGVEEAVFAYRDERWGRCRMEVRRDKKE